MIAHIVLFKTKRDVSSHEREAFAKALRAACQATPAVQRALVGRIGGLAVPYLHTFGDTTYDFAAILDFKDETGLREYLGNPAHKALSQLFWQTCEQTLILDVPMVSATTEELIDILANSRS